MHKHFLFLLLISISFYTHADLFSEDKVIYNVVINHEEQYSIWPADRENALGWENTGFSGTKQECLDHIDKIWTDMRPLSLRKKMMELEAEEAEENAKQKPK